MKRPLILLLLSFLLVGCATRTSLKEDKERLLASLYQEGSLLVYVDAEKVPEKVEEMVGNPSLAKRIDHLYILLSEEKYPLDGNAHTTILVEGSIPSFALGIVMGHMEGYEKQKEGFWRGGKWSVGLLEKHLLMLTDGNWTKEKERILSPAFAYDPLVGAVLQSPVGIYAKTPTTFFPLDFEISDSLLSSVDTLVVSSIPQGEESVVDASIVMEDEKKATSLNKLIRSGYVKELRKAGKEVDVSDLRAMFTIQGNLLTIHSIVIPDSQLRIPQLAL